MKILDEIDKKIVEELNSNARIPLKDLSAKAYLTTPAVSARIDKLEKEGFIRGYYANLDYKKMGYLIKAYIMVSVKPEDNSNFYEFINAEENVFECDHITGTYSMLLMVRFESMESLDLFLGKLQDFGKTETQVVFSTIKEVK
ncbi:Lrp/AsnC family leucine-responsive transcriptional regulator [Clostridiales Family XIII bacterium PM5-7]